MKRVPKQLVIDKDVFQGTDQATLCKFAENHFLILPEGLLYECLTSPDKKDILSGRFEKVMLAGAYICPSVKTIVFKEAQKLSPYSFLPDLEMTTGIRRTIKSRNRFFNSHHIQEIYEKNCKITKILLDAAHKTAEIFVSKEPESFEKAKKYQDNRSKRFRLWVETVTSNDIHKLAIEKLGYLTDSPDRFCLSDNWITWNYFCFVCVIHLEYTFLRIVNGVTPTMTDVEHDCQDIEYVTYLSRVDGMLTRDKRIIIPVAKAAFPGKDVFSSLEEVQKEYVCHWS